MSGLLSEEEAGRTDLGTLEKRLAEKASSNAAAGVRTSSLDLGRSATNLSLRPGESTRPTPQRDSQSTPQDSVTSPSTEADKDKLEDVENLSEAMCSLVTNNVGETRYIGKWWWSTAVVVAAITPSPPVLPCVRWC